MPEDGIPGNTRILPLTLRGPTAIRIPPKGVARSDSRHHQKGWETGLWNTKSIPPNITPQLSGKDYREDDGYTPRIFFLFIYLIHTAGKPRAYGIARKNIARHIKPQLSWGCSDTQQQLPRGPFPNPTAIVMVWPI